MIIYIYIYIHYVLSTYICIYHAVLSPASGMGYLARLASKSGTAGILTLPQALSQVGADGLWAAWWIFFSNLF